MASTLTFLFSSIFIPSLLLILTLMFCKESILNRVKFSPFECGFEEFSTARIIFSLKFYLIVIIFLVFDAEIALMLPVPLSLNLNFNISWLFAITFLTIILILGLFIEWKHGAMSWTYYKVYF